MAATKLLASTHEGEIPKEESGRFEPHDFCTSDDSSDDFCTSDDSSEDPTFNIIKETRSKLSKISLKKSRPRKVKDMDSESENGEESFEVEIPELNQKDGKCFDSEKVEELIKDRQLQKLKIEQCKVYLRKYGLRLTGNKGILIERIKEHLGVINGGGEKKYPISSFVLNCKGDACTGDVVMFEQKVYEMFDIASRSAIVPPCGTRVVAGRIVKESYGAAKQQHTFTIEVLWSTGEKPLPPLHPLLIKGRNLYRLKTMRQRWTDEEERRKVLQEKHSRGYVARCSRETRVKEKEMRKTGSMKRSESSQHPANPIQTKVVQQQVQPQDKENNVVLQQNNRYQHPVNPIQTRVIPQKIENYQHPMHNAIQTRVLQQQIIQHQQQIQQLQKENVMNPQDHIRTSYAKPMTAEQHKNIVQVSKPHRYESNGNHNQSRPFWSSPHRTHFNDNQGRYQTHQTRMHNFHHRQQLSSSNRCILSPTRQHNWAGPRQWCRYYRQGRCYHGENCKYLHE